MPPPLTPRRHQAALRAQEAVRCRCIPHRTLAPEDIHSLAGADVSYTGSCACAAVVVASFPDLAPIECATAVTIIRFPYAPGFFAFREGPALLKAFHSLTTRPDIAMLNGHGYAHPRRIGLATHIGVLLDLPTVGVAGRPLVGTFREPGPDPGATEPLVFEGEQIGLALRTRTASRPIILSAGHRTDLALAEEIVAATLRGGRMPLPLLEAHRCAAALRAAVVHGR
ncbi:MAG: endonuclease V [Methanomicrobiaceae archaeon]|nr:endonuclease V [Methanomicrobiaceae archaeon]